MQKQYEVIITEKELRLLEAKAVGTLYHLTTTDGILHILATNQLRGNEYEGVSLTRNPNMNDFSGSGQNLFFKLVLDGDAISENHKITPYQYNWEDEQDNDYDDIEKNTRHLIGKHSSSLDEYEEHTGNLDHVFRYIKAIVFLNDKFQEEIKKNPEIKEKTLNALEKINTYNADFLIISLGVDTFKDDPISHFCLESNDYFHMGEAISKLNIPTLFVMEGGYMVDEIGINAVNTLLGFEGKF